MAVSHHAKAFACSDAGYLTCHLSAIACMKGNACAKLDHRKPWHYKYAVACAMFHTALTGRSSLGILMSEVQLLYH